MKQISSTEFDAEVLRSKEPVLVDFFTDGCGPCRIPVLEELATEGNGQFKLVKVDAASEASLAASFGVNAVPALFVFKNGNVIGQTIGLKSKATLKKWFEDSLRTAA
jgi:thioredoxin 1